MYAIFHNTNYLEKLRRALFGLAGDPILKEKKAIDAADIAVRNLVILL